MTTSPKTTKAENRFDEQTITYSGEELRQLLDELASRADSEEITREYPITPEEMAELLAADQRAIG